MPVWKLTPIDLSHPNWEASSQRRAAVVRAPDEDAARTGAGKPFDIPTRFPPRGGAKFPARRVDDPGYEAEGPTEILEPVL
jgi:hypothetical protein